MSGQTLDKMQILVNRNSHPRISKESLKEKEALAAM